MIYNGNKLLQTDARKVAANLVLPQRQDPLVDQLRDLHILATRFGMCDAADFIHKHAYPESR
jgi:hypothetical protein